MTTIMKITADNYEQWAMDYLEGTLPRADREAFDAFLATDPRAASEIRALEAYLPVAEAEAVIYPDKESLLRRSRVTPLRRLASLSAGAAAAAVVLGALLWITPSKQKNLTAENYASAPRPVREKAAPVTAKTPEAPEATVTEAPLQAAPPASERAQQWNRKTSELLARLERRRNRQETQSAPERTVSQEPLFAFVREATAATREVPESLRQPIAKPGSGTLLPADATTPILAEYLHSQESGPWEYESPENTAGWASESRSARREGGLLRSLLNPIEKISPVKYYETEEGSGVEIISIIRIGSKN